MDGRGRPRPVGRPLHATIEEMAAHYAREMRSLHPRGPFYLVGHSMGGWIAYAVACELISKGEKVALLAMLDTQPTAKLPASAKLPFLAKRLKIHVKKLARIPRAEMFSYVSGRARFLRMHLCIGADNRPHFEAAGARYRPGKYRGDVDLLVTGAPPGWRFWYWKRLVAGRLRLHSAPGGHSTLIDKPYVSGSAAILQSVLRRVEARAGICSANPHPARSDGPG